MGLPEDLVFRTKGQLAIDLLTDVLAGGIALDFVCGDEVYGSCTQLRAFCEARGQGYVLRVPSNFHLTLARGVRLTCKQTATRLLDGTRSWEVRSAGQGSKGGRRYGWVWLTTTPPRHYLLVRRHRVDWRAGLPLLPRAGRAGGDQLSRPIRAAGLRWPVEEGFEFGKGSFGLDESQVRLYTAITRHTVLAMAALAICAVTAALLRRRTDTHAPPPAAQISPHPPIPASSRSPSRRPAGCSPSRPPPGHRSGTG